ncbi:MAG: hypothetical protein MJ099_04460, partial [Clostridia bacterium]|nr:hypothetical protein [Clostridia bacterium]
MYNSRVYSEEYTVDDKQATFEEEETFFYDDSCDPSELPFPAAFLNLEGYELVYENAFNGDAPSYCGYYSSNTGFIAIDAAPVGGNHVALYDADGNQLFTADDALLL